MLLDLVPMQQGRDIRLLPLLALVLALVMQVEPEGSRQLDLDCLLVLFPLLILMVGTSMFARLNPQAADLSDDLLYCGEVRLPGIYVDTA